MYCKSCGSPMEETYNVCQNCGTKKGMGAAFCEKCGEVRQAGVAFCMNCGNKFVDQPSENSTNVPFSQQTPAQQFQSNAQMNQSQYLPPKKYCRNCGAQVMNNQMVCTKCGVKVGDGKSFCPHCAAAVTNPQQVACMNCGMSLKEVFDANSFFSQFGKNFASMFNFADPAKTIFKFGPYMLALLVFIFNFLPNLAASYKVTRTVSGFFSAAAGSNGVGGGFVFCGVLLIFTLVIMLLRFEPHIYKFIEEKPNGRLLDLVLPGLELVALVSALINIFNVNAFVTSLSNVSIHLSVCGWILMIFILASVVLTILGLISDKDKLTLPKIDEFIFEYGPFVASILCFYVALMPSLKISLGSISYVRFGYGFISQVGDSTGSDLGLGGIGFANVLFILTLLVSIAALVPPLHKLVMKNPVGGLVYFINPALSVVALIASFINFIAVNATVGFAGAGIGFSFWGIILILFIVGNGVLSVFAFIKKMPPRNNFNNPNNFNNFNNQNNFNNPGNFNNQNGFNNNNVNANANVNNGFNNNNNNNF